MRSEYWVLNEAIDNYVRPLFHQCCQLILYKHQELELAKPSQKYCSHRSTQLHVDQLPLIHKGSASSIMSLKHCCYHMRISLDSVRSRGVWFRVFKPRQRKRTVGTGKVTHIHQVRSFRTKREAGAYGLRGVRVGEAQNPGPGHPSHTCL